MAKCKEQNSIVKESNVIARAQLSPPADSVWSERIIAHVAAFNRINDTDFPDAAFMIGRLVDNRKKLSTRQYAEIYKATEKLAGTTFTIFESTRKYKIFTVFDYIAFDNGMISARLNQSLKPHYLELKKQFTVRSLPEFRSLTSIYSQQIFRYLNSLKALGETTRTIDELHQLTGAPPSITGNFAIFQRRVLNIAHREINAKTSLKFDWEPIKTGRKVTAVKFVFGQSGVEKLEKTRHTGEKKTEKEILLELQTESIRCWEKHRERGKTCKPRKSAKRCEYCTTRGKMSFSK